MHLFALPFKKNVLGYQVASLDMMECVKLRVIPFLISSQLQMDHIIQFSEFQMMISVFEKKEAKNNKF